MFEISGSEALNDYYRPGIKCVAEKRNFQALIFLT